MHRPTVSYQFDDVILNSEAFSVTKAGRVVALEPKSIRLLLHLIQNRTRVVDKEELLSTVWEDTAVSDNALARVVAQLRKALGDDARIARYIETVPTVGYRFVAEVFEVEQHAPASTPTPRARNFPWAVAGALTLLAVAGAILLWQWTRPGPPASWTGTLLEGSIIASHPRISPDGQLLAFRAIVDNQSQVAVMKPDSSSRTVLTRDRTQGAVIGIAWSHDGSRIYFDREWGSGRIYSIGPLGGEPRLILENAIAPEPLRDGSLIALRPTSDGRQQLIRFWPESGITQALPASVRFTDSPNVRAFPDGNEIAVFGLPEKTWGPARLFILNLQSLETRSLTNAADVKLHEPIAISRDGRSILLQRHREDTVETVSVPRSGSGEVQTLLYLPAISAPLSLDAASDGSLYMDHCGFDRSILNLSPSGNVNAEIPTPQLAEGAGPRSVIALPDGSVIFDVRRRGRSELFVGRSGAEPRLLLNSPESAGLPGALLGTDSFAFIIGEGAQSRIAVASLRDGSVAKRFPGDAREVTAIAAPADGQTIYYADNGTIWAQPVSGSDRRKVGTGYDLTIDPSGKNLYLMRTGSDGYQLYRMPAAGGEAVRVSLPSGFDLTPLPLSSSAVHPDGRILLPISVLNVFFFQAALFDPARNVMSLVPVPPRVVVTSAGWTSGGSILARIDRWSSSLWRYHNSH